MLGKDELWLSEGKVLHTEVWIAVHLDRSHIAQIFVFEDLFIVKT